jgi:hypothetical protein
MPHYYSNSTQGFYGSAQVLPSDAIALTDAQYSALLAGVNSGQCNSQAV